MEPPLYDYRTAAAYLGCTDRYVRMLVARRELPHRRIGRLVRFTQEDLDRLVERARVEVADA